MGILKRLAGQTGIYGASSVVGRLLNYLLVPIYTTVFLPPDYGIVAELYAYAGFGLVLFTYGMETTFFRFASKEDHHGDTYNTGLISIIASSSFLFLIILVLARPIGIALELEGEIRYIWWFGLILALDAIAALPFAKLRQEEKAKRFALIKIANIGINIGLNLFLIVLAPKMGWFEASIDHIFLSNLAASGITLLLLAPELKELHWDFDAKLWRKMIIYALPLLLVGLGYVINEMVDRMLLRVLLEGTEMERRSEIGIYSACYKLSIIMTLFVQAFRYAAEPFFFRQAKEANAKRVYATVLKYFSIVCSFIFLAVMLNIGIVKHFIGGNYHEGLHVVPILLLANYVLGIYYNLSIWYKITDKTYYGAIISLGGAAITIALNIALIPVMGFTGSAWTTLICYSAMTIGSYLLGQRYFRVPYNIPKIMLYTGLAIGIWLLGRGIDNWFDLSVTMTHLSHFILLMGFLVLAYLIEMATRKIETPTG